VRLHTNRSSAFTIQRNDRFGGLPTARSGDTSVRNVDRSRVHLRRLFDERLLTTHLSLRSGGSAQRRTMIGPNGRPGNARRGKDAEALHQETIMLKNVAAALIAVTMFTAPVLAQSVAPVSPAPATPTIKATSPVKHVKIKKHTVKKVRVGRHHMHVKHVRHAKSATHSHSARLSTKPAPVPSRTN
jgi:hypothetical protein